MLVSERSFDTILTKMSDCYQPNKLTRIEAKGKKYEIGDFAIKVGSVFLGPNFKCLVIEVLTMLISNVIMLPRNIVGRLFQKFQSFCTVS